MATEHVENEIVRLHDFFVTWMTGSIMQTDDNFAQFADSMSDGFYIVAPSGHQTHREALVDGLYNTYNKRQNFRIWIENVTIQHNFGDVIVATYEEWQEFKDENKTTSRLSTVVFTLDETVPNQLLWQCVHETWMPETET